MAAGDDGNVVYSDEFLIELQLLWGEGFLLPGGCSFN